jgi:predicted HTH transcriptional regulator
MRGIPLELKPHTRDSKQTYKVRQTIAAFANRQGGFLIIGIKDKKMLSLLIINLQTSESLA